VELEGQARVARVHWLSYEYLFLYSMWARSRIWVLEDRRHRLSPLTAEDVGQPFIARRTIYIKVETLCACARAVGLPKVGGKSQDAHKASKIKSGIGNR
jgi:hypothetical protein